MHTLERFQTKDGVEKAKNSSTGAQESAEHRRERLDHQRLRDRTRRQMDHLKKLSIEEQPTGRLREDRHALLARETTEQTQQHQETECRCVSKVSIRTDEGRTLKLSAQNSHKRVSRAF